jgi:hypothetical protein
MALKNVNSTPVIYTREKIYQLINIDIQKIIIDMLVIVIGWYVLLLV